jgi:uncharacterized protein (TIGR02266 family)
MRIRLKYADVATFVERFASHVSRSGIFIASRVPKPVGTVIRFEFLLADGKTKLIKGEGTVSWVREFDGENPLGPHGMGLRFARLDPDSRQMVDRIVAFKRARGVRDDGAVPQPVDKDEISSPIALPLSTPPLPTFAPVDPPAPSPEMDALLASQDDLDGTLAQARAIARRLVDGDVDLESLLADDGDVALPPPPQVVLPPLPSDDAPTPPPPPPIDRASTAPLAIDIEISEPTRVSPPPVPEALDVEEEQTRERAPTPMPIVDAEDVRAILDALGPPEEGAPSQDILPEETQPHKPEHKEKKGFFSKLFKK